MQRLIAGWVFALACGSALAAPSFKDADQWRRDFRKAVDGTGSAMLTEAARPAHTREFMQLETQARKLFGDDAFGPWGACLKAAQGYLSVWTTQLGNLGGKSNSASANAQSKQAFEAGISYTACRDKIDALESARPSR